MKKFLNKINRFWKQEDAPTMAEYGLLLVLIAVVVIAGATAIGTNLNTMFSNTAATIGS